MNDKHDEEMLNYCTKKASEGCSGGRVRVYSAACDKNGNIIAEAMNNYKKSSTLQYKYACRVGKPMNTMLHSEVLTLTRALKTGRDIDTLYIARVGRNGLTRPALPCIICSSLIETEFNHIRVVTT